MTETPQETTRLAIVTGDRFCTGCGYNLVGQPTLRIDELTVGGTA